MSNLNMNKSLRHMQVLLVFLCMLFLVLAIGNTEARYRAEKGAQAQFQVWEPAQIYLGTLSYPEEETEGQNIDPSDAPAVFDPAGIPSWKESDGIHSLELAVANGFSEEYFYAADQQFHLYMLGSLGLGTEAEFPNIELRVPSETEPETYEVFQATVNRIQEGTTLYHSVGSGWIIRFQDENGQEPSWILKGGSLSYKCFVVTAENLRTDGRILIQPYVTAAVIQK